MRLLGAVAFYNPCSVHARYGVECPFLEKRTCKKPPKTCGFPEYDRWFKDVIAGSMKSFYPRRMRLLEHGGILFIYHGHVKGIVGEATITKSTYEDGNFHYWFNNFITYPTVVKLNQIKTDDRLSRLAHVRRWSVLYIGDQTINEIRSLAGLPEQAKNQLQKELEKIKREKKPFHPEIGKPSISVPRTAERIKYSLKIDPLVAKKADEIILMAQNQGMIKGRSAEGFILASIYVAHKLQRIPKTLRNFMKDLDMSQRHNFSICYKVLMKKMDLEIPRFQPEDYVRAFSEKLRLTRKMEELAISYIEKAKGERRTDGRNPAVVAGAGIWLACQEEKSGILQVQIGRVIGVTTASIRNVAKELCSTE